MPDNQEEQDLGSNRDFSSAIDELREIVSDLEQGRIPLEEAMEKYGKGRELIDICETKLENAELLIQEVDDSDPNDPKIDSKAFEE